MQLAISLLLVLTGLSCATQPKPCSTFIGVPMARLPKLPEGFSYRAESMVFYDIDCTYEVKVVQEVGIEE